MAAHIWIWRPKFFRQWVPVNQITYVFIHLLFLQSNNIDRESLNRWNRSLEHFWHPLSSLGRPPTETDGSVVSFTLINLILPGARQVSQESLVCWAEYSVAILYYCFKNIKIFHYNIPADFYCYTVIVIFFLNWILTVCFLYFAGMKKNHIETLYLLSRLSFFGSVDAPLSFFPLSVCSYLNNCLSIGNLRICF